MHNIPIRKILASVLFVLIILFIYLVFRKLNVQETDSKIIILFGGIVFSSLFLFSITFSRKTIVKTVYEKKKEIKKISSEEIEKISFNESLKVIQLYEEKNDINELSDYILRSLSNKLNVVQGVLYVREKDGDFFTRTASYALYGNKKDFKEGSGINGQVAINKKIKVISEIPEGYISVVSGLGAASPKNLLVIPFVFNNKTIALVELAAFDNFPEYINDFYFHINDKISKHFNKLING